MTKDVLPKTSKRKFTQPLHNFIENLATFGQGWTSCNVLDSILSTLENINANFNICKVYAFGVFERNINNTYSDIMFVTLHVNNKTFTLNFNHKSVRLLLRTTSGNRWTVEQTVTFFYNKPLEIIEFIKDFSRNK